VGSSSIVGALTWNANDTLNQLGITDPLNSKDAQTCSYAHDDLARLSGVNCGSPWSQTFIYDAFGNVTKSGSISWQPGYNAATNRYTLAGTSYDENGNLTADTFHTYTWDGNFGTPLSIDTTNLTYDALGRLTETANGTTYTQFVYGPTGKLATMHGQTVSKVFIALPAGDQAVYTGANNFQGYRHSDWLGSSRVESSTTQTKMFDGAYAPFGESYSDSGSYDHFFTGQIPGVASDLYDFPYREYHPKQGRWLSPDPAGLAAVDFSDPQTWNRYTYVGNQPCSSIDPSGLSQNNTTACPAVPAHPANANVNSNIALTTAENYLNWLSPPTHDVVMATWLTAMVAPHMAWDYKTQGQQYDAFGNFNFGATAGAAGYPLWMLQMGAGAVSTLVGTNSSSYGSWYQPPLYGHPPAKSQMIAAGYAYYTQGCYKNGGGGGGGGGGGAYGYVPGGYGWGEVYYVVDGGFFAFDGWYWIPGGWSLTWTQRK